MSFITTQQLSRTFDSEGTKTHALREATFEIKRGEFVSIMGASGSGKSTLLHILGLLDRLSGGRYFLADEDTSKLNDEQRAHLRNSTMGFVFQAFHLLSRATVLENVLLPLYYSSLPPKQHLKRAHAAIEQVELTHRLHHSPGQLSGGEKQRVAIARALVNQPDIIFADEPTGNLDSRTGQAIMKTIDHLHQQGHTIIVITHETPVAKFAQRIITMRDGLIVSDKSSATSHQHEFTK